VYPVQHIIEPLADVLSQKPKNKIPVFLQQCILAAVAAIRVRVGKVLASIEFDD
jgi:hypothetical protein